MLINKDKDQNSFLKGVTALSGGSILAQAIAILGTLIASRIFSPEVFGVAAVFTSISLIISSISCLRYELAIVLPEEDDDGLNVLFLSFSILLISTVFVFLGVVLLKNQIVSLFNLEAIQSFIWLIPIRVFFGGALFPLAFWFARNKEFTTNGIRRILSQTGVTSFVVGGGLLGFTQSIHLILFRILGIMAGFIFYLVVFIKRYSSNLTKVLSTGKMVDLAKRYSRFPKYSLPEVLLTLSAFHAPILIMTSIYDTGIAGRYNHAVILIGLPLELIASAVSQVYFQKISDLKNKNMDMSHFTEKLYTSIIKIVVYPAIAFGFVAPFVFSLVLGKVWYESGVFVAILIPLLIIKLVSVPLANIALVFEKQDASLYFTIILSIIQIGSLLGGAMTGNPRIAVLFYMISGVIMFFIYTLWLLKIAGSDYHKSLMQFFKSVSYSLPFIAILVVLKFYYQAEPLQLLYYIIPTISLYLFLMLKYDTFLNEQVSKILNRNKN